MASDTTATRVHNVIHNRTETAMKRAALALAYDDASRAYDRNPTQENRDRKNAAAYALEVAT